MTRNWPPAAARLPPSGAARAWNRSPSRSGPARICAAVEKAVYEEIAQIADRAGGRLGTGEGSHAGTPGADSESAEYPWAAPRPWPTTTTNFGDANLVNSPIPEDGGGHQSRIFSGWPRQYLTEENRTVIVTMPKKAAARRQQPKQ